MPGRRPAVLAQRLVHCAEVLVLEDAAGVVLDHRRNDGVHHHAGVQAVGNVLVQQACCPAPVVVVTRLVGLGDHMVDGLLLVDW